MQALSLRGLLGPLDLDEFLATYWRKRTYFRRGATDARDDAARLLGGLSAEHLANRCGACDVVGHVGKLDRRDNLTASEALAFYARGHTLYLNLMRAVPECGRLAEAIVQEAGLVAPLNLCCAVFVSKPDRGVQPHLDVNENFTVQLSGCKVWTIWTQGAVANPLHGAVQGEPPGDPVAGMYMGPRPAAEDLGPGEQVVMEPGCVLYHPSGVWHTTRATTESVSLNVSISPVTYYQLMLGVTEARLATSEAIRRDVPPRRSAADGDEFARCLTLAIEAAKRAVQDLDPADALVPLARSETVSPSLTTLATSCSRKITPTTRMRRNALVALDVERKGGMAALRATLFLGRMTRHTEIAIPAGFEAACRAASGVREEFDAETLARREVQIEDALVVCMALEAIGAFRCI